LATFQPGLIIRAVSFLILPPIPGTFSQYVYPGELGENDVRITFRLLLMAVFIFAITHPLHAKQEQGAKDSVSAEKQKPNEQPQKQTEEKPIDLSGIWIDRDDLSTDAWVFTFSTAGDEIVIMNGAAYSMQDVFAWATLTGRSFAGSMNTAPGSMGDSFIPLRIQGTISAENNEIDMTVYYDKGTPGRYHLIRKK